MVESKVKDGLTTETTHSFPLCEFRKRQHLGANTAPPRFQPLTPPTSTPGCAGVLSPVCSRFLFHQVPLLLSLAPVCELWDSPRGHDPHTLTRNLISGTVKSKPASTFHSKILPKEGTPDSYILRNRAIYVSTSKKTRKSFTK